MSPVSLSVLWVNVRDIHITYFTNINRNAKLTWGTFRYFQAELCCLPSRYFFQNSGNGISQIFADRIYQHFYSI